jgi:hypothetical protein
VVALVLVLVLVLVLDRVSIVVARDRAVGDAAA